MPSADPADPADSADQLSLAEPMCSRRSTRVFDDRHELVDGELEPRMRESFTDFVHVDAWGHLWTGPTA